MDFVGVIIVGWHIGVLAPVLASVFGAFTATAAGAGAADEVFCPY